MSKRGPHTDAGKALVRLNAVRHGVLSTTLVIPGLEREDQWETHRAGVIASLQPDGYLEEALAERIAQTLWRLQRLVQFERETIALQQEEVLRDLAHAVRAESLGKFGLADLEGPDSVQEQCKVIRQFLALLTRLPSLADDDFLTADEAVTLLTETADAVEVDRDAIALPGAPDRAHWQEFEGWTAGLTREALGSIARHVRLSVESLLSKARQSRTEELATLEQRYVEWARRERRLRRERLLPVDDRLDKVMRYEAHLSRQLYQALHELEALQARRRGQQAPLARLEVNGLINELA